MIQVIWVERLMSAIASFILKVVLVSLGVAIAIKLAPPVSTPTAAVVLTIVWFPSVVMAIVLGWNVFKTTREQPKSL